MRTLPPSTCRRDTTSSSIGAEPDGQPFNIIVIMFSERGGGNEISSSDHRDLLEGKRAKGRREAFIKFRHSMYSILLFDFLLLQLYVFPSFYCLSFYPSLIFRLSIHLSIIPSFHHYTYTIMPSLYISSPRPHLHLHL